ncbi:hypothetical protein B0H16DRAFT_1449881 [Mycena metata]|uniref:Uncharacterized protein n=1 Tax=Mycena metata TaxID=1033252 RepID=A0AAD7K1W1_9AGAR|nr:hypothetical protein B0H16DRAFT_1449881 [Mycena metata]
MYRLDRNIAFGSALYGSSAFSTSKPAEITVGVKMEQSDTTGRGELPPYAETEPDDDREEVGFSGTFSNHSSTIRALNHRKAYDVLQNKFLTDTTAKERERFLSLCVQLPDTPRHSAHPHRAEHRTKRLRWTIRQPYPESCTFRQPQRPIQLWTRNLLPRGDCRRMGNRGSERTERDKIFGAVG